MSGLLIFQSCSHKEKHNYFYETEEYQGKNLRPYFIEMERHIYRELKSTILSMFKSDDELYASSHGFDFYNGESVKLKSIKTLPHEGKDAYRNKSSMGQGFGPPTFPTKIKDVDARRPIDPNDYYARVYLELSNTEKTALIPVDFGVEFYCGEVRCRKTSITKFYNYKTKFKGSDYISENSELNMLGIYYKWKPHITEIRFNKLSSNNVITTHNVLDKYKNAPVTYHAVKHRLLLKGMKEEEITDAIGNGEGLGFKGFVIESGILKSFKMDIYQRDFSYE